MYEFNGITTWSLQALAIDFAIIIALFVSLKFIKGWVSNLHANDEITERDNFAFGISFAAGLVALAPWVFCAPIAFCGQRKVASPWQPTFDIPGVYVDVL